ncbi:pterin binding enzyme family protein, partial [Vibrio parahaemolyticus V-223/04]
RTCSCSS